MMPHAPDPFTQKRTYCGPKEASVTNVLFVDIDGTLICNHEGTQYLPPSAARGLAEARRRGSLVYLCTGRSLAEIGTIGEVETDGLIGAGGGLIITGDTVVTHRTFTEEQLDEVEGAFERLAIDYYLETNEGLYFTPGLLELLPTIWGIRPDDPYLDIVWTTDDARQAPVNKVSFHSARGTTYDEIEAELRGHFHLLKASWGDGDTSSIDGEVMLPGIDKARAIRELLAYLDLGEVRTFAFGDSMNDAEMLVACDEAIVMAGARHGVERYATYVTDDVLEDGLANALKHFDLA